MEEIKNKEKPQLLSPIHEIILEFGMVYFIERTSSFPKMHLPAFITNKNKLAQPSLSYRGRNRKEIQWQIISNNCLDGNHMKSMRFCRKSAIRVHLRDHH